MLTGVITAIAGSLIVAGASGAAVGRNDPVGQPPTALSSLETEQATLFARVAPSVVLLMRDGASGSGFIVGRDGLVLTNAHVVGEGDEVTVQLSDGRAGTGRVIARATGALDLALVRVPFTDLPPLAAGDASALRAGTFAATVGHGGGAAWTFSTGLVANPRPLGDSSPVVLAQMALRPGSSGGPLVDRLGRAVAIVTAGTRDASGVTFAIRVDAAVRAFPQLEGWAYAPASRSGKVVGSTEARPAGGELARVEPEPQLPVVEQLSGGAAFRPSRGEPSTTATEMITVWEAPRSARRAVPRSAPRRPLIPAHAEPAAPATPAPAPRSPFSPTVIAILAIVLAGGALVGRAAARSRG
jgi:S1-C subfamily serine protease